MTTVQRSRRFVGSRVYGLNFSSGRPTGNTRTGTRSTRRYVNLGSGLFVGTPDGDCQ